MLSWRREFLRELAESCSGREHPLGNLPVVVVSSSAETAAGPATEPCQRDSAAEGLARLSSNTLYVVAEGSGHEIHLFQPAVLVQMLERSIAAIREGAPLSR